MFQWLASLRYGPGHVELVDDLNQLLEESWDDMLTAYRRGRHGRQESRYATPRPTSEFEQKVYIARHKRRSTMFQWLTKRPRPYPASTFGGDLIKELVPGHRACMVRRLQHIDERDKLRHEKKAHELNKARLEQELKDAEWILDYEKRLISLQQKTARQRSQAQHRGANTDRLRKLEHHLTGLRRSLVD